jgi:hypothetical protein
MYPQAWQRTYATGGAATAGWEGDRPIVWVFGLPHFGQVCTEAADGFGIVFC